MWISRDYEKMEKAEKIIIQAKNLAEPILFSAVFSDETERFRFPKEPTTKDIISITLRTARENVDAVFLCGSEREWQMIAHREEGLFSYYTVHIPPQKERFSYYFKIVKEGYTVFYTKKGISEVLEKNGCFVILPGYQTPAWAKGAVMYQIYVDRFCKRDTKNDVKTGEYWYLEKPVKAMDDWETPIESEDFRNFYGGDLQGVMEQLDYLDDLGIEVIYFNPLFLSPSNHKYDTQDYNHIDPHIAVIIEDGGDLLEEGMKDNRNATKYIKRVTSQKNLEASDHFFAELVEKIHERGMHVILDGVFNHCGGFHYWLDREGIYEGVYGYGKGALASKDSPYHDYFNWKENGEYQGWWDFPNHPKLNFEASDELEQVILQVAKKWVSPPFCVDGWRLDVAADLGKTQETNHQFWRKFRNEVKQANPNTLILAEHYGDASAWLQGNEWDTVMNYDAFMDPIGWFFTGMEKHSNFYREDLKNQGQHFVKTMQDAMARLPLESLETAMNELSNHDHSRFLTRTNGNVGRLNTHGKESAEEGVNFGIMKEAVLLQMTFLGAPTIYYGDEAGLCGWTDPDNRRTYPWGKENQDMMAFHKAIISLRKEYPVFRIGSLLFLESGYGYISFGRFDGEDNILVVCNNLEQKQTISISVWQLGVSSFGQMKEIFSSHTEGFSLEERIISVENGTVTVELEPFSGYVFLGISG